MAVQTGSADKFYPDIRKIEVEDPGHADTFNPLFKLLIDNAVYLNATKAGKEDVDERIRELIGAAPAALDTLKELADALDNNPNFAATVTNELSKKVEKVAGKQLSTEDYTTTEKTKLANIAMNANNYIHPTAAGNKHIPAGGATGNFLKYNASGTAVWATPNSNDIAETADKKFVSDTKITEWDMKETPEGAQAKVDAITSEQINYLGSIYDESKTMNNYPIGISLERLTLSPTTPFNGHTSGWVNVETERNFNSSHGIQRATVYGGAGVDTTTYIRSSIGVVSNPTWLPWEKDINQNDLTDLVNLDDPKKVASAKSVKTVNDNLTAFKNEATEQFVTHDELGTAGYGDMLKRVYDKNDNGIVDAAESVPWSGVTGKPSSFTPSSHLHPISDISNLQSELEKIANSVTSEQVTMQSSRLPTDLASAYPRGYTYAPMTVNDPNVDVWIDEINSVLGTNYTSAQIRMKVSTERWNSGGGAEQTIVGVSNFTVTLGKILFILKRGASSSSPSSPWSPWDKLAFSSDVTSEKINVIPEKLSEDLPSAYPNGISTFYSSNTTNWQNSVGLGTGNRAVVRTERGNSASGIVQTATFYGTASNSVLRIYQRASHSASVWGEWEEIALTKHVTSDNINRLPLNAFTEETPISEYPYGYSVMYVTSSNWSIINSGFAVVETMRTAQPSYGAQRVTLHSGFNVGTTNIRAIASNNVGQAWGAWKEFLYKEQTTWIEPVLLNGWRKFRATRFFKDELGIVHVEGNVTSGTADLLFTFPAGYRPSELIAIPVLCAGTGEYYSDLAYLNGSELRLTSSTIPSNVTFSFSFRAEN